MKKVLILAYDFPPYVSVGGLRPHAWYKYLKEFGVEPIVVTRQWGNVHGNYLDYISEGSSDQTIIEETEFGTIIQSPYQPNAANRLMLKYGENKFRIIRKSISAFYEFVQFLFAVGPKSSIYKMRFSLLPSYSLKSSLKSSELFLCPKSSDFGLAQQSPYPPIFAHQPYFIDNKLCNHKTLMK